MAHTLTVRWVRAQGQQDHYHGTPGRWLRYAESQGFPAREGAAGWRMLVLAYEGGYAAAQHRQENPPSYLRWARGEK